MKSIILLIIAINILIGMLALANIYVAFLGDTLSEMYGWIVVTIQTFQISMLCAKLERTKEVGE